MSQTKKKKKRMNSHKMIQKLKNIEIHVYLNFLIKDIYTLMEKVVIIKLPLDWIDLIRK